MALARVDAALRKRSVVAWLVFRFVTGFFVALGLYAWLFIWFERHFILGVAQAFMCAMVLAHEFGILPTRRSGTS